MTTIKKRIQKHGILSLANFFNMWSILFFVTFEMANSIILANKHSSFEEEAINLIGLTVLIIILSLTIFMEPFKLARYYFKFVLIPIIAIIIVVIPFMHPMSLIQFSSIIRTITRHNPGEFIGHGNHCGFSGGFNGGQKETVDLLDACCQEHDTCWNDATAEMSIPYIAYLASYKFNNANNENHIECISNLGFTQLCLCDMTAAKCFKRNLDLSETFRHFNGTIYYDKTKYAIDFNLLINYIIYFLFAAFDFVLNNTVMFISVIIILILFAPLTVCFVYKRNNRNKSQKFENQNYEKIIFYILNLLIMMSIIKLLRLWQHGNYFNSIIVILVFFNLLVLIFNFFLSGCLMILRCRIKKYQPISVKRRNISKINRIKLLILLISLISCVLNFLILVTLFIIISSDIMFVDFILFFSYLSIVFSLYLFYFLIIAILFKMNPKKFF